MSKRYKVFVTVFCGLMSMGPLLEGVADRTRDGIQATGQWEHALVALVLIALSAFHAAWGTE
jgi:hypothetical protein